MERNLRRPIVFIALAFSSGIVVQHLFKINMIVLVGLLPIGNIMACIYFHNRNKINLLFACLMITVVITGALCLTAADLKPSIISSFNNQYITGEGTVKSIVKKDEKIYKLVVVTNQIFNAPVEEKTIINYYGDLEKDYALYDLPGRKIYFEGLVTLPDKRRNPNTFDYRLYLRTVGIDALIKCDPKELEINNMIEGKGNQILNYLSIIKGKISKNLVLSIGEKRSGVISGMMWGEKDNIDDDIMEQFRMNGTAHILAVSGIHVGLVYLYLNKLFWGRRNVFSDMVIIILLICYAAMANFSPSVMRAVSMIIIHIISKHTYCRYDFLCSGAVTLIIMLIMNPFSLFNIGFQLSFLAIFTLAVILPFMQKIGRSFMNPVIALQFGLSPMTAFTFNYFSLSSLIANIPVIFLASLIIPLGLLTIPLTIFNLPFFFFHVTAHAMGCLTDAMLYINDFVFTPGKSFFYTKSPTVLFLLIYYFTLFFITSELFLILYKRQKYVLILKVIISMLVTVSLVNIATLDDFTTVSYTHLTLPTKRI